MSDQLDYEGLRRLAMERAKRDAERMYPEDQPEKRKEAEIRLTNIFYKRFISREP